MLRIERLIVGPEWRGLGIGSHLLGAVERLGLERGCDRVRLEIPLGADAEQFYAGRGYVATTTLPRWREERDFAVMERDLVITVGGSPGWGRPRIDRGNPPAVAGDRVN